MNRWLCRALALALPLVVGHAKAAEILKNDDPTYFLNQPEAWVGNTVPGAGDVAVWNNTVTWAQTLYLGADLSWAGIKILDPGGAPTIETGNRLTLGAEGIDMSAASQDLTLNCDVELGEAQTWALGSGRLLTIGGALSGGSNALLTVRGPGQLRLGTASTTVASTAAGGMLIDGAYVLIGCPQSMGQLSMPAGTVTFTNGGKLRMNGWNSTSSTGWGSFTNPVFVPTGTWGIIDVFGRGAFSSRVQVNGTLYLGVSYVRGDVSGDWSACTGYIIVSNASSGGDFRLNGTANFGTASIRLGPGVTMYRADNYGSGGTTTTIGELTGVGQLSASGATSASRTNVFVVGGRNSDARFDGTVVNGTRVAAIRKVGTGAWLLSGNNPYTGITYVESGKLVGVTGGSISNTAFVVISNNATLGVQVEAAGPQWVVRNVQVPAGVNAKVEVNYGGGVASTSTAPMLVLGTLTLDGNLTVDVIGGSWGVGTYPLIVYTNFTGAGSVFLGQIPSRVSGYLTNDTASGMIALVVTSYSAPLKWATGNGTWDKSTLNWVDAFGNQTYYQEVNGYGDAVLFEDISSGVSPITVSIGTTINNAPITVDSSKTWTLSGPGSITGLSSITKAGAGVLRLEALNSFSGGIYLRGGVVEFSDLRNLGATNSALYFDGGTLRFLPGNTADVSAGRTVTIGAGGGAIDTGANTVTFASAIGNNGAGGLTKLGTGTFTLSGANSYRGATIISQGTLALASGATVNLSPVIQVNAGAWFDVTARGGITLVSGQTLKGTGTVLGSVTAGSGSYLAPGDSVGTLTISGTLTVNGGTIVYDVAGGSSDRITVNGDLSLTGGTFQIQASSLPDGTYRVIDYTGLLLSGSGSAGSLVIAGAPPGKVVKLDDSIPGQINLLVQTPVAETLTWAGVGTDWDINTSYNWLKNGSPAVYVDGANVVFDNTGAGQPFVNLTTTVLPGWVTVDATVDYTFGTWASGRISGSAGITKRNTGTLYIQTANNNSGPLVIENGRVYVGTGGRLGTGNITNDGVLEFASEDQTVVGNISGTGSLAHNGTSVLTLTGSNTYSGGTIVGWGAILQVGNGGNTGSLGTGNVQNDGAVVFNRANAYEFAGQITGSGAVTNAGSGTTRLSGANSYSGYTAIASGTLQVGHSNAIPEFSPVFMSGGYLDINGYSLTLAELNGTGGTIINSASGKTNTLAVGADGNSTTFGGVIADNAGTGGAIALHKIGGGTLMLTANNSYSGGTVVAEGQLTLRANTAAGVSAAPITISNKATLFLDNPSGSAVYVANPVIVPADAIVTIGSDWIGNELSGNFYSGNSNSVVRITGPMSIGQAATKVFQNFEGTVEIAPEGTIRFSSTSLTSNGGDNTTFQVDGGIQTRNGTGNGPGVSIGALTGSGSFWGPQQGTGTSRWLIGAKGIDTEFAGTFGDSGTNTAANVLVKVGQGILTMSGYLTHYGATIVSNGTLKLAGPTANPTNTPSISVDAEAVLDVSGLGEGSEQGYLQLGTAAAQTLSGLGTVRGSVKCHGDNPTTLAPGFTGTSVGTLTVTGRVELASSSTVVMELARPSCDRLVAQTIVPNGATLVVTNIGDALQAGDTFQLFSVPVSGFASIQLPELPESLYWTNRLAVDGSIQVLSAGPVIPTYPTNITCRIEGGQIEISWPDTHIGWRLQAQTNTLAVGLSTNWVDVPGSELTNVVRLAIGGTNQATFFRLVLTR